jgi:hypothetical protein
MSTAPIDNILNQLEKVKQRQPGQWSACCPGSNHAHGDKTPSLSVRETESGSVLLYCFAGCGAAEIVSAMGLTLQDLYPRLDKDNSTHQRPPRLLTAGQALDLLREESLLLAVAAGNVAHGVVLSQVDLDRLVKTAGRIAWLRENAMGVPSHG